LAAFAPVSWWALYTGFLAYILIGLGFTVEFIARKRRFRRFGTRCPTACSPVTLVSPP
jgi:uncharacterized membrane protein